MNGKGDKDIKGRINRKRYMKNREKGTTKERKRKKE